MPVVPLVLVCILPFILAHRYVRQEAEEGAKVANRIKEALGIVIIGDGVVATVAPVRHSRLWQFGPSGYQRFMQAFIDRPNMTRISGLGQVAFGLWLASRQWPR